MDPRSRKQERSAQSDALSTDDKRRRTQPRPALSAPRGERRRQEPSGRGELRSDEAYLPNKLHTRLASYSTERVDNVDAWPAAYVGRLFSRFGQAVYATTAWLVGKRCVYTLASALFDHSSQQWADEAYFFPRYGAHGRSYWASHLVVHGNFPSSGDVLHNFGAIVTEENIGDEWGWAGWIANTGINQGSWWQHGYPSVPIDGYPFDGRQMWRTLGPYSYDYSWMIVAGGNMTAGAEGSPWFLDEGRANGMTNVFLDDGTVLSPYFGNEFLSIIDWLKENGFYR